MHLIFFSSDFYIFFLCICVCNTKGDAHKPCGPPKREGKPILPRVWKDLAHCAKGTDEMSKIIKLEEIEESEDSEMISQDVNIDEHDLEIPNNSDTKGDTTTIEVSKIITLADLEEDFSDDWY